LNVQIDCAGRDDAAELKKFQKNFHLSTSERQDGAGAGVGVGPGGGPGASPGVNVAARPEPPKPGTPDDAEVKEDAEQAATPPSVFEKAAHSTLNPNAKEFVLNPNAKAFTPVSFALK
jgi:hypothetical protein